MTSSIQQSITMAIRMAFVLEDYHLRHLDQILRTGNATVEYIAATKSLVFTTYESVEDLIRMGNLPDDPLSRLEARRITGDTHVTLLFLNATELIRLAILNDDSRRPDFRHEMSAEIAAWLEQIKAPHNNLVMALRSRVLVAGICLVSMVFVVPGFMLQSGDVPFSGAILIFVGVVVIPLLVVLVLWIQAYFFSAGQFNFGSGRKTRRNKR